MEPLPNPVFVWAIGFLDATTLLLSVAHVCKRWHTLVVDNEILWKRLCLRDLIDFTPNSNNNKGAEEMLEQEKVQLKLNWIGFYKEQVRGYVWDPKFTATSLVLSNTNHSVTATKKNTFSISLAKAAFSSGVHTWYIKVGGSDQQWMVAGVCPNDVILNFPGDVPQASTLLFRQSKMYGVSSEGQVHCNGSYPGSHGFNWKLGETLKLTLNCEEHTLTMASEPPSDRKYTVKDLAEGVMYHPYGLLYNTGNCLTILRKLDLNLPEKAADQKQQQQHPTKLTPAENADVSKSKCSLS